MLRLALYSSSIRAPGRVAFFRAPRATAIRVAILALCVASLSSAAIADEGVLEINHTCAEQTGCLVGDAAGYPVTITRAGSYRLTSNLTTSSQGVTAISITADDVSLDLGGFTIACALGVIQPAACSNTFATGQGISASGTRRVTVRNGVIQGMRRTAVELGEASRAQDLVVSDNDGNGISVQRNSIVEDSMVVNNGGIGLLFSDGIPNSGWHGFRDNVVSDNATGVGGFPADLGGNLCVDAQCP